MTEVEEPGLLAEGIKSYPKALAAMNEFVRLVTSAVREAVLEDLDDLSSAMGVRVAEEELVEYVRPNKLTSSDSKEAILGAKIDRIGNSGWGIYFYLWWSKAEPQISASIWLRDAAIAESLFKAFKKMAGTTRVELYGSREVYISRELKPDDAGQLSDSIRELTQKFSELWTKAGGLDRFVKPQK
jgi:hypothetical protein